jgi:flagellar biosynthesis protein FlhF
MRIRKFEGANMREALERVRKDLGAEAMVVSTRNVRRGLLGSGVEVTAAIDVEEPASPPPASGPTPGPGISESDVERIMAPLRSELRSLRSMLRPLMAQPTYEDLRGDLASLRQLISSISAGPQAAPSTEPAPLVIPEGTRLAAPPERRVMALVGPTGVGKTTTIAKLAARSALIERKRVALVTLDAYRVGGEEQIRAYADLIGVPLYVITDATRLVPTIGSLDAFDRVYIDTAGRSPRESDAIHALHNALTGVPEIEVHLVLHADSCEATVSRHARRYGALGVARLLFTKLDEAEDARQVAAAPARLGWPVSFVTTGQRIPEDLEPASDEQLRSWSTSGYAPQEVYA